MADANVPIKFEIYKGDQLVREEVLAQSPIKIGKLASSDLRLDDETVSRMHGVIEATGPGDVHVIEWNRPIAGNLYLLMTLSGQ